MQALKPVRKIVYAKVHGSSKDCLSSETNTIFPTLRSLLEAFFSKMIQANKKNFDFSAKELHNECSFWIHLCGNHLLETFASGIL